MSMSEYEKLNHKGWDEDDLFSSSVESALPDDFSEEDVTFARELGVLFSPEEEIAPPYFAQTLLQAEDPRYKAVDNAFARRTTARVFRSLKLRRSLFAGQSSIAGHIRESLHEIVVRKSLVAWASALLLVMLCTVAFTAPSFEQGITILLGNPNSGVLQVHSYPKTSEVHRHAPPCCHVYHRLGVTPLVAARQLLHFNIYTPQWIPANFSLSTINIYMDSNVPSDGPVAELVYTINTHGAPVQGTGQIIVREFKPYEQVLQVVEDGNAYPIDPDRNGTPKAIYVDGQWMLTGKWLLPRWDRGTRSEVIYQQDGVVFWIAGDQRDGVGQKSLWKLASSLQVMSFAHPALLKGETADVLPEDNSPDSPFYYDLVSIPTLDGVDGQYYVTMSSYIAGMAATSTTSGLHGHFT